MKMKSTHHVFRAVSLAIGLALLVVTGTAAMIGAFSPVSTPGLYGPLSAAPATETVRHEGEDSLLYTRMARADGSYHWVLTEEPAATLASAPPARGPMLANVSYTLVAKPAGLNKLMKNCSVASNNGKSKPYAAYDLACHTLG